MSLADHIPFLAKLRESRTLPDQSSEAEARKERIAFHREKVRNGPASFRTPTTGQVRRFEQRQADRLKKKAYRRQVREYLALTRRVAVIRGELQAAGVVAYHRPFEVEPERAEAAVRSLARKFWSPENGDSPNLDEQMIRIILQRALHYYQQAVGLELTTIEWA